MRFPSVYYMYSMVRICSNNCLLYIQELLQHIHHTVRVLQELLPVIVLLPAAYLLSLTGDVNNIWWAFIIAEGASLIASLIGMKSVYNKEIKNL